MKSKLLFLLGIFWIAVMANYYALNLTHVNANAANIRTNTNDGYVDPSDITPNSTVHVSDAKSFIDAIYRSHKGEGNSLGGQSVIHKIILDNDINLSNVVDNNDEGGLSYSGFGANYDYNHCTLDDPRKDVNVKHGNLVIDGNGHALDMMFNTMVITNSNEQWTLENMTVLDSSTDGILGTQANNSTINYRNISYYGSQLIYNQTPNCITNIYGYVNVHSLPTHMAEGPIYSDIWYGWNGQSYEDKGVNRDGDQPNIQTGNIEFHANSHYFGETYDSDVLKISGNMKVDDNAQLDLHPHGNIPDKHQPASGVNLTSDNTNNSELDLGNNIQFNIFCDTKSLTDNKGNSINLMDSDFISRGINASSNTRIKFNGVQSHIKIYGNGRVFQDQSLVLLDSMQANISGDGNEFQVNEQNSNNSYHPQQGVMQINASQVNITNGGTFAMNIKLKRKNNYDNKQLVATNSTINIDRPKHVTLSNYVLDLSQRNRIIAQNVNVNAKRYNSNMQSPWETDNTLIKYIQFPLVVNNEGLPSTYLIGSYFNVKQLVNGLKVDTTTPYNNLYYLDFTGTPVPHIVLDNAIKQQTVSTKNNEISGTVEDNNGQAIPNAYIKIHPDEISDFSSAGNTDNESNNFYQSNDNYGTYINSQEVLFSTSKNYPSSLTENNNDFRSLSDANDSNAFSLSHGYFFSHYNTGDYNEFNKYTTLYDEHGKPYDTDPYVAISDAKGHFQFKVPDKTFDSFSSDNPQLDIVPSYNFTDGTPAQLHVNADNPKINFVRNTISDTTYPEGNANDGLSLTKVFQGFPGANKEDTDNKSANPYIGDTINYHVELNVSNTKNLITGTLHQPVPFSMDEQSLQISYDNGRTYQDLKNYQSTLNSDGTKTIDIYNLKDNNGSISLDLKGNLNNNTDAISNSTIIFKPTFTYGGNKVVDGHDNKIEFTDNSFTFKPHDIDYGMNYIVPNADISQIYPINMNQPLITDVQDNRRDQQSAVNIFVQQTNDKFVNDNDNHQTFIGHLMYNNQSLLQPVKIFTTASHKDLYLNRHTPIYLALNPTNNLPSGGNYSTQLQWTVNYGLH
jgi:hypothetical protein